MNDPNFFRENLKDQIKNVNAEVAIARLGGMVSQEYVSEVTQRDTNNATRKEITHNAYFKQYIAENPVRPRSAYNATSYTSQAKPKA